jgi:hypothetical protein
MVSSVILFILGEQYSLKESKPPNGTAWGYHVSAHKL